MPLLRGMLASLAPLLARPNVALACFDIGLDAASLAWLRPQCTEIIVPGAHFGLNPAEHPAPLRSFLARPFLPEYFPGYDTYVWIDSDVWLQDSAVFDRYVAGAQRTGLAIAHERERAYRLQLWLLGWTGKHLVKGYGTATGLSLLTRRHLNAGFFAASAGAPHWAAWAARYQRAIAKSGALVPHDQFSLVQTVHTGARRGAGPLETTILDAGSNWICDRGVPMWNDARSAFCKPYAPFEPIGAMHLAGPAKVTPYLVKRTGGGTFTSFLTHGASPARPAIDGPLQARQASPAANPAQVS